MRPSPASCLFISEGEHALDRTMHVPAVIASACLLFVVSPIRYESSRERFSLLLFVFDISLIDLLLP